MKDKQTVATALKTISRTSSFVAISRYKHIHMHEWRTKIETYLSQLYLSFNNIYNYSPNVLQLSYYLFIT